MTHTLCALIDRTGAAMLAVAGLLMAVGVLIAWRIVRGHECGRCADLAPEDQDVIELARRNS